MRSTKIVNVDTLMLADASCIESDTSWISDNDWKEMLPTGSSLNKIESQLESGESVVLSDSPRSPLFTFSQGEWIKSVSASSAFPSCAVTAITQRFSTAGSSTTFERAPYESLHPSPPLNYTPDTSKVKEQVVPISCQYNVEVACSPPCLETLNYGYFMLAKTKNESDLTLSTVKPLGKHTLLTTLGKFEEPKQLWHMLATGKSSQLSVKPVKMVPLGSQQVYESFVPVQLTVQVGERLGYPTQGVFYHFKQGQLVHEYAIVEDAKGYFNITHSTANALSDEVNIPALRGCIFLPWKINGQLAAPQHIVYSKQKLTTEEFQGIDATWLNTHAFTVDLQAILAASQDAVLERAEEQTNQQDKQPAKPQNHAVLPSHDGPGRESWPDIAKQYGLTPNELLALNPTFQQDPMKLKAGDILIIAKSEATQDKPKVDTQPPQAPQAVSRADNIYYQSSTPELAPGVIGITKQSVLKDVAVLNLGQVESGLDIDDVYLFFSDKKMDLYEFADEVYGSRDKTIIDHVMNSNPQLKKSFSQIHEGMPLVVSPWKTKHEEEDNAIAQAEALMTQYLTLSTDERQWFADNHDVVTEVLATAAEGGMDSQEVNPDTGETKNISLNTMIASMGAVIAGAGTQGGHISQKMKAFADYSNYISSKTEGLKGQALYSNSDYKAWRTRERAFRTEMKSLLGQMGKPGYIKGLQANNIGHLLNINKRQIYRSKDFAKAVGGIDMTRLYKQAMSFSKQIKAGGWIMTGLGLYGNAADIYQTCDINGLMSEACGRSTVRNISSGVFNGVIGYYLGVGLAFAPVTGGLSIILVGGGALLWGMNGGVLSNDVGSFIEEVIFD
ncbi:hypothetical protein Sps_04713 [Shewanella psychrophila]|uniref:LysM domain-containing protein n=1 Tax=Shewanella psychrophila TaxID=225848 RepID=A0A1S6HW41_9GAMM|nr:LysM peptidoglycan-binding domain-containing protein [Shewanella psychrophila]AQS39796.1 hypothetical protein Sps_04713 [Shewanella psychrophila]